MPTIPTYNREVSLEPQFTATNNVRATPEAFGAAIGRGMQDVGQGIDMIAKAKFTLEQKLQDNADRAARIRTEKEVNNLLLDPDNGILNRQGTGAVGAAKAFQTDVEELRASGSKGLQGQALTNYNLYFDQMIVERSATVLRHESTEVKKAVDQSYVSLADTYLDNAVTYSRDPAASRRYIDEGVKVLRERGVTFGMPEATVDNDVDEYVRNAHKVVAMTIASEDPLAAQAYVDSNRDELGAGFYEALTGDLKPAVTLKQADQAAADFLKNPETQNPPSGDGTEADDDTAAAPATTTGAQGAPTALPLAAGKNAISVTNLDSGFTSALEQMIAAMPEELRGQVTIYSGWRPATRAEAPAGYVGETQDEIFAKAVAKYGSEAAARKHAAPPGKSNHNRGQAADLRYGSDAARDWIHANAAQFGLSFPMGHEPWHIEPVSARGGNGGGTTAATGGGTGGGMPTDAMAVEEYLSGLPADVQDLTRKKIYGYFENSAKMDAANRTAAKQTLWDTILQTGAMPTDVSVLSAAGMEAVSSAQAYLEKGGAPDVTNEVIYRRLSELKAERRENFVKVDMNNYRQHLTVKDFEALQQDQRDMLEGGKAQLDFSAAHTLSKQVVEAQIGPAPSTSEEDKRREYDARLNALYRTVEEDMRAYQAANKVVPLYDDILKMVTARTLPTIEAKDGWFGEATGLQFEMADPRLPGFKLDAEAIVPTIPLDIYNMILADLKAQGISQTPDEIATAYQNYLLWETVDTND